MSLRDLGEHRLKDLANPEHLHDLMIDGLPSDFPPIKTLEIPTDLPAELTSFVGASGKWGGSPNSWTEAAWSH